MTRNSSFILLSFAILHLVMAAKGNHTITVVKGKEDYRTLQTCFADVFLDIHTVKHDIQINVDDKAIELDFFEEGIINLCC